MAKKLKKSQRGDPSWAFQGDKISAWAYWDNLFSAEECKKIIQYAEQFEKQDGVITLENVIDKHIRNSKIVWVVPEEENRWVYRKIVDAVMQLNQDYFGFDLYGITEPLQFTEYNAPSGHYEKHVDSGFDGRIRKLSISIQLSDPKTYKGGELKLYTGEKPDVLSKEQGTLLCFPSWTLHEVSPVTKGKRYSLVAWVTGNSFK